MLPFPLVVTAVLALVIGAPLPAAAGPYRLLQTLYNPTPSPTDFFGYPVEPLGSNLLIGDGYDDGAAVDGGAVYLLDGNPTSPSFGTLLHTFTKPAAVDGEEIGFSVATMGTNVLIGSTRIDTAGPDAGAVYMFDGDLGSPTFGTVLQTFLNPAPTVGDYFGYAITPVGGNVAVADFLDGWSGQQAGAVYLFDPATGDALHAFFPPQNGEHRLGYDMAAIGTHLAIGAPHAPSPLGFGAVYIYDADPASPTFGAVLQRIENPTERADEFGSAVGVVGGNVLVGAPFDGQDFEGAAYLFDPTNGALLTTFVNPNPTENGQFGYAVASLGTYALVGAQHDDTVAENAGAVYVYDADPASPTFGALVQSLFPPAANALNSSFGVAVTALGTSIVVGAAPQSIVHVFTPCGDGIVSLIEDCEDGNVLDGDCCSATCEYEASGSACDDGDGAPCTSGACDGAAACLPQGAVPQAGCRAPITSGKSQLRIDSSPGHPSKLQWQWKRGAATPLETFGNPLSTTAYALCVFDESAAPQPILQVMAPAGGSWQAGSKGFKFKNAAGTADGARALKLAAGPAGKAAIALKGGGANLTTPALPLTGTVTVQLKGAGSSCWESTHRNPARNGPFTFKALSD